DDIGPAPGLVADQLPAMAGACIVLRQQDVAGTDGEALAAAGLELQRAAEGDHEARHGILVPFIGSAGSRLLEGDAGALDHLAEHVASLALGKVDRPLFEVGIAILAGPKSHASDHGAFPCCPMVKVVAGSRSSAVSWTCRARSRGK